MFIVLEGIDGSGKTTQLKLLQSFFAKSYGQHQVLVTREPGGTKLAEQLRQLLVTSGHLLEQTRVQLLLFNAARADLLEQVILPSLEQGIHVLCDRFFLSTMVYQHDMNLALRVHKLLFDNFCPDLVIVLDVPPEKAMQRIVSKGSPQLYERHFVISNLNSLYARYLKAAAQYKAVFGESKLLTVDASQSVDAVHNNIIHTLKGLVG